MEFVGYYLDYSEELCLLQIPVPLLYVSTTRCCYLPAMFAFFVIFRTVLIPRTANARRRA
jgi:hypothetical protein